MWLLINKNVMLIIDPDEYYLEFVISTVYKNIIKQFVLVAYEYC